MKSVVVTGANSFIGIRICKKMSAEDWYVYAVVRKNCKNVQDLQVIDNVHIVYSGLDEYDFLYDQLNGLEIECAILLAWSGTRGEARNDTKLQEYNRICTIETAKKMMKLGCEIIVLAGSQAEYGINTIERKVLESDECNPNTEYGIAKLEVYNSLKTVCKERKVRLIEPRFFSLYGEDDYEGTMIISIIRNMLIGKECNLTECKQIWDFMYVEDAIEGIYRLIENPLAEGVVNFGSGKSMPLKEYVEIMYRMTKSRSVLNFGIVPYPKTGMVHTNPSIEKFIALTKGMPLTRFEMGLQRVIACEEEKLDEEN